MQLRRFSAKNYRNIAEADILFSPGMNLLSGENAQGKTNVLDAIYTFARGRSFRGSTDPEQVKFGESGFRIAIDYQSEGREHSLSFAFENGRRERKKNGYTLGGLSEMIGSFRAVLFYPEHLSLVKGGPAERRAFLNIAISQLDPLYIKRLAAYGKRLEERNFLLKTASRGGYLDRELLDSFSFGMATDAAYIHGKRVSYLLSLSPHAAAFATRLSGGRESLSLAYAASLPEGGEGDLAAAYYRLFTENLARETAAGTTLFGPQRDDMEILIGDKPARVFGSQGQQRTVVLALKLGEGEVSREYTGEYPVYLFDDVLSELDEGRRLSVLSCGGDRQMIVTGCEKRLLGGYEAHEIRVAGGTYTPILPQ